MIITAASDLHGKWPRDLPPGDVLILAGDILADIWPAPKITDAQWQLEKEIPRLEAWVKDLPYRLKIFVPGNHEFVFEEMPLLAREALPSMTVLIDDGIEFEGLRFWGTPWVPYLTGWAFYADTEKLTHRFSKIPRYDLDVLVSHGPPQNILDHAYSEHAGSKELLHYVKRSKPQVHIFGHIHESHGRLEDDGILFVNVACAWREHSPEQIEIFPKKKEK